MGFIKKHYLLIAALSIALLFLFTRLFNLLALPIFTDEAIYVRWSQIAKDDATWRFISLTDGKQPMFVWIAMVLMKFISDPLLAGRMVSVLAGLVSTVGIFFLASEIFNNKKIGILASILYVLFPFALVYDRLALYDSLVAMFIIWSLYFEVLLVRHLRLDLAMILGTIAGLGMLTKTNASFALILLPFSLLLFNFKDKKRKQKLLTWILFAFVAVFIANAIYTILRLSPFFHIIADKNYVFIYTPQEWLQHPFTYLMDNLRPMSEWLLSYGTAPFLLLVLAAFLANKNYLREKLLLLAWFVIPFGALAVFGRVIYPRFIFFMMMSLLVLGAYTLFYMLTAVKKVWLRVIIVIVFLAMFVVKDYFIITDFAKAPIPQADKSQFLTTWPAGVGVSETVDFLKKESKDKKIYVATQGTFGLMPYALEIYLHDNPNITIVGYWPIDRELPKEVIAASKKMPTYFVFYQACHTCEAIGQAPKEWAVEEIFQKSRLDATVYTLYKVKSP